MSGPGRTHQRLLLWASRRMVADGFLVAGFDGEEEQGGPLNALPRPFPLRGRRADAWGATADGSLLSFAEAKTAADILTTRTIDQLRTFGVMRMKAGSRLCPLYVAVPREAAVVLDEALRRAGLLRASNIVRLHVPEALLTEKRHVA